MNLEKTDYTPKQLDPKVILPRAEFFQLGLEERKYLMSYWRSNYTTNAILKGMGYNNSTSLYKAIKRLGLPTDLRKHKDMVMQEELKELGGLPQDTKEVLQESIQAPKSTHVDPIIDTSASINTSSVINLPDIVVSLNGKVPLDKVQEVIKFAQRMELEIKVNQ